MKFLYFLIFSIFFSFFLLYAEDNRKVLAILDIEAKSNVKEEIAEFVSERIRVEMFKTGSHKIVERQKMNKVLEEQKLTLISSSDDDYIKKIGNLLSADQILVGSLSYLGSTYYLNVRIIEVKSGEMVFGDTEKASSISDLSSIAERVASKISGGNKKVDFQPLDSDSLDSGSEESRIKEIGRMVKSVVEYTIRRIEDIRKSEREEKIIENESEKIEPEKTEIKEKKQEERESFVKFGGGLLVKYHNNVSFKSTGEEWSSLYLPFSYGLKGILGFGDVFGIGLEGTINGSLEEIGDKNYVFGFGYGGITLELYYRFWKFLRLGVDVLFGWSGANFYVFYSDNYEKPIYERRKDFFVCEPAIMLGIKFFNTFEIGVKGSYLYTSDQEDFLKIDKYNIGAFLIFGL
ncbi:MAG: CsgG/HfaB family protein [Brevinematia bacterium]